MPWNAEIVVEFHLSSHRSALRIGPPVAARCGWTSYVDIDRMSSSCLMCSIVLLCTLLPCQVHQSYYQSSNINRGITNPSLFRIFSDLIFTNGNPCSLTSAWLRTSRHGDQPRITTVATCRGTKVSAQKLHVQDHATKKRARLKLGVGNSWNSGRWWSCFLVGGFSNMFFLNKWLVVGGLIGWWLVTVNKWLTTNQLGVNKWQPNGLLNIMLTNGWLFNLFLSVRGWNHQPGFELVEVVVMFW